MEVHLTFWRRKAVAITMGFIALVLLVVSVSRQRAAGIGYLLETHEEDQLTYREAKASRLSQSQVFRDLSALDNAHSEENYSRVIEKYRRLIKRSAGSNRKERRRSNACGGCISVEPSWASLS
jgi:hypothetical protein